MSCVHLAVVYLVICDLLRSPSKKRSYLMSFKLGGAWSAVPLVFVPANDSNDDEDIFLFNRLFFGILR